MKVNTFWRKRRNIKEFFSKLRPLGSLASLLKADITAKTALIAAFALSKSHAGL